MSQQDERETQESTVVDPAAAIEAEIKSLEAQMYEVAEHRDDLYNALIKRYDNQVRGLSQRINRLYDELAKLRRRNP